MKIEEDGCINLEASVSRSTDIPQVFSCFLLSTQTYCHHFNVTELITLSSYCAVEVVVVCM